MKFVSLRTNQAHRPSELAKPSRCLDPWATVGPSLFRVTSRPILRTTSVNGQK
jgi:hypothetical protein